MEASQASYVGPIPIARSMSLQEPVWVYALRSEKDGSLYIGISKNPQERLTAHNQRKTSSNRSKVPLKIIFTEQCEGYEQAREREKYWKSGSGREKLRRIIDS